MEASPAAVVACRVHSGWAAAVCLSGNRGSPELLLRERLEMADADDQAAKQPYHAAEEMPIAQARAFLEKRSREAAARAEEALATMARDLQTRGRELRVLGILQASGRQAGSLEATLASHALIHTADGEHFRDALATAGTRLGLEIVRLPERQLGAVASKVLRVDERVLAGRILAMGRPAGPPWGADQKAAALFAWTLLKGRPSTP
jgi:hypothetical protein